MQSLPIFIVELQAAKRALLKNFELLDDSRPYQNATQRRRVVKMGPSLTVSLGRYQIRLSAAWMNTNEEGQPRQVLMRLHPPEALTGIF